MHTGSENTINGKQYDVEMHVVHLPNDIPTAFSTTEADADEFFAAAMGMMFDVDDYDQSVTDDQKHIINTFFDTLDYSGDGSPVPSFVNLGALLNMADYENRYAFRGSLTTPPCTRNVYFNVMSTIYPIRQSDLDKYNAALNRITDGLGSDGGTGNYRKPQPIDGQDVVWIKKSRVDSAREGLQDLIENPEKAGGLIAATVIFAVIAFFALIGCAVFGYQAHSKGDAAPAKEADVELSAPAAPAEGDKAAE